MTSLFQALKKFSGLTTLSRVLGFVRDITIARIFGSNDAADAFFVAFRIPNLFRRLFAEGAFSQAFIPVLVGARKEGVQQEHEYINASFSALASVLLVFCALGMLLAPWVVAAFAPGFARMEDKFALTTHLLRLTFPYLLFISLTALLAAILNIRNRFAAAAFAPVYLNICLIGGSLVSATFFSQPIIALGWSVFVAGVVQFLWLWFFVARAGYRIRVTQWYNSRIKRTFRLIVPALFGVSVTQINLLIDTLLASLLVGGSVSWLYYSDRMMELPLGVFGVALGTVVLPSLSKYAVNRDHDGYQRTLNWAMSVGIYIALPACAGLMVLSYPIMLSLFAYGEFSIHDARMSSLSLFAYAVGLPAFIAIKIIAPSFYAYEDMKTPVKIAVIALITNVALNLLLIKVLAHAGLALATSLSAWLNAALLLLILQCRRGSPLKSILVTKAVQATLSAAAMVVLLLVSLHYIGSWDAWEWQYRTGCLSALVVGGGVCYVLVNHMLGFGLKQLG